MFLFFTYVGCNVSNKNCFIVFIYVLHCSFPWNEDCFSSSCCICWLLIAMCTVMFACVRCVSMPKGLKSHAIIHNIRMNCIYISYALAFLSLSRHTAISFGFVFYLCWWRLNINGLSKITRRILTGEKTVHIFYPLDDFTEEEKYTHTDWTTRD